MTYETEQMPCPLCGNHADIHSFGRAGLSPERLQDFVAIVIQGQLPEVLNTWEMFRQRYDPESTSAELSTVKAIDSWGKRHEDQFREMNSRIGRMESTWNGIGKGKVSEILVANALRQLFPEDKFDQSKSAKKVDLLAIVDKNNEAGKICISVKDEEKWRATAITQAEKNMMQENTKWAIIVAKKLPAGVPPEGKVFASEQGCYVLVHFEHLASIYTVLREYVVATKEFEEQAFTREQQLLHTKEISHDIARFIESAEYKEFSKQITSVKKQIDFLENDLGDFETTLKNSIDKMRGRLQKMRLHISKQLGVYEKIKKIFHTP